MPGAMRGLTVGCSSSGRCSSSGSIGGAAAGARTGRHGYALRADSDLHQHRRTRRSWGTVKVLSVDRNDGERQRVGVRALCNGRSGGGSGDGEQPRAAGPAMKNRLAAGAAALALGVSAVSGAPTEAAMLLSDGSSPSNISSATASSARSLRPPSFSRGFVAPMLRLTSTNPISNPNSLLRYALPIKEDTALRQIQDALESIREDLRVPGVRFSGVSRSVNRSLDILSSRRSKILAQIEDETKRQQADKLIDTLQGELNDFRTIVDNTDRQAVPVQQQQCLSTLGSIEELMVNEFPFDVPAEYAGLPLLKGRATVEVRVKYTTHVPTETNNDTMTMVLDGFNAPVTSGNFVDLVQRKFYDGMKVQRADGFVVQTGDPDGPADGFVDPSTEKIRTIPFELRIKGDKAPEYEFTVEDLGRPTEEPVLPFNAYGTLAMARVESDANSASSQIFWLLKESEVTPSNTNILDGNYAVFGYVVSGADVLRELQVGDLIESVKVTKGIENLENPSYKNLKTFSSVITAAASSITESSEPFEGRFSDPMHPEGYRVVTVDKSSKVATIRGKDDPKDASEWEVKGIISETDGNSMSVDFSPKGGPKDLTAKWVGDGIDFGDNKWSLQK